MDVLVKIEARPSDSPVLAHVNSIPVLPFGNRARREVVTLYEEADVRSLALALAAMVESDRLEAPRSGAVRHLGIWPDRGAVGDSAWRDAGSGKLETRDHVISFDALELRAAKLMDECGSTIRRVAAGLRMVDWPEGAERALSFSFSGSRSMTGGERVAVRDEAGMETWLDSMRQADAYSFDGGD